MELTPIFSSDHSVCDSVLTLSKDIFKKVEEEKDGKKVKRETDEPEVKDRSPVSLFALAKVYQLDRMVIVESSMSSFWEIYKIAKGLKVPYMFGLKICVCDDLTKKDPDSLKTESNVIIFCNNSQAYYDLIKISSQSHLEGFYQEARTSWRALAEHWTPNLSLAIPFYSSFLARNLMYFGQSAMPVLDKLGQPIFLRENHGLPFDGLITETMEKYCSLNGFEVEDTHTVYYHKDADAISYQALKCIGSKAGGIKTLQKPNLDSFGSDQFSFESYRRRIGKPL